MSDNFHAPEITVSDRKFEEVSMFTALKALFLLEGT
jgi:hypothetical protein